MKKFAMIALMVTFAALSASASQLGPQSSWKEIQSAGLIAGFPTIFFSTEGVTVDELCVEGDNLRPVQPYRTTCAKFDNRGDHFNCIEYVTTYLTTPRAHTESRCVKYNNKGDDCVAYEAVPAVYPTSYLISVYKSTPRAGLVELFRKPFEIPACQ